MRRLAQPDVRITPHHFALVRVVLGLSLAFFFIGIHIAFARMGDEVPEIWSREFLTQDLDSKILAANVSTMFCISGVAGSLLLALGYFRRITAAFVLLRLLVILWGHWLQMLGAALPAVVLLFLCLMPGGGPWALLQDRRETWRVSRFAGNLLWVLCSIATLAFVLGAVGLQLHLVRLRPAPGGGIKVLLIGLGGLVIAASLGANLCLLWRPQTRAVSWVLNVGSFMVLGGLWFTDRALDLHPRVWGPWALVITVLYLVVWVLLFDNGIRPGIYAVDGGKHVVFYDGVCGLCNGAVRWLLDEDADQVLSFAPLQGDRAGELLSDSDIDPTQLDTIVYVRNYGTKQQEILIRSRAVLAIGHDIGGMFGMLAVVAGCVPRVLLDLVYRLIARTRYRIFGKNELCLIPDAEIRDRFLT